MTKLSSLCVYCGSGTGNREIFAKSAYLLGSLMASANIRLVYGGGERGIMGAISRGVRDNGGQITGVIPNFLLHHEANKDIDTSRFDEYIITESMHERKQILADRADGFVALPGGIGTLEEIVEIMTWAQLERHNKPIIFANIEGFWDPMFELLDHMTNEGFLKTKKKISPLITADINEVIPQAIKHLAQ